MVPLKGNVWAFACTVLIANLRDVAPILLTSTQFIAGWILANKMGATAIILVRVNTYSCESAILKVYTEQN